MVNSCISKHPFILLFSLAIAFFASAWCQYLELQKKQSELRAQLEEAQASQRASQAALAAAMDASQQQQQAALAAQSQSQSQQASSVAVSAAAAMEIAALKVWFQLVNWLID